MIKESQISHTAINHFREELYILKMDMQKKISRIDHEVELTDMKASEV